MFCAIFLHTIKEENLFTRMHTRQGAGLGPGEAKRRKGNRRSGFPLHPLFEEEKEKEESCPM